MFGSGGPRACTPSLCPASALRLDDGRGHLLCCIAQFRGRGSLRAEGYLARRLSTFGPVPGWVGQGGPRPPEHALDQSPFPPMSVISLAL